MFTRIISIYRGEGRILVMPVAHCSETDFGISIPIDDKELLIKAIDDAYAYIIEEEPKLGAEYEWGWKKYSKYKSRKSFVKNNNHCYILYEDNIKVNSMYKSEEFLGQYIGDYMKKEFELNADTDILADAVIEVLDAIDSYYH